MIQVCSQCGTRWNVRDRRRELCPRCNGMLLAPVVQVGPAQVAPGQMGPAGPPPLPTAPPPRHPDPRWGPPMPARSPMPSGPPLPPAPFTPAPFTPGPRAGGPRLPPGFRWIAVRPGPPPPPRAQRRPLGPTPRYAFIPRWGLVDNIAPSGELDDAKIRNGPSPATVRGVLLSAMAILVMAALVHVLRYGLLLYNRTTLLPRLVANVALLMGVVASLAAVIAVIVTTVTMTSWLTARRSAVFRHRGQDDPRPSWALWICSLVPLVNLVWAPVFVIELAHAEDSRSRLRTPIAWWWAVWIGSTGMSIFAIATSFTTKPQGIADNTVSMIIAYVVAAAAIAMLWRVFDGFVLKPVERPAHRWIVVSDAQPAVADTTAPAADRESPAAVEPERQEPAA